MFSSRERTRSSTSQDYSFVYFFLIAVAYKVPWTAISSLLGQLSVQFQQPSILLWLNLAYFLPSLPALLLHSSLQEKLEQRMGLPRAAMGRFVFGLGGLVLLCLALPYCCGSITALLAATAAVGVCYSIAFGTSYQLVTHFPPGCTVALTTGFVSCGVVVLAADLLLKHGPYYSAAGMARLFQVVALQTCLGLAAAAAVLRRNWKRLAAAGPPSMYTSSSSSSRGLHRPDLGFGQPGSSDKHIIGLAVGSVAAGGLRSGLGGGGLGLGLRHRSELPVCAADQALAADASGGGAAAAAAAGAGTGAHGSIAAACLPEGAAPAAVAIHLGTDQPAAAAPPPHNSSRGSSGGKPSRQATSNIAVRAMRRLLARCSAAVSQLQQLLLVAVSIWPAALGLLLSVGSSMLAFPFFTFVPHSGAFGERLPQVRQGSYCCCCLLLLLLSVGSSMLAFPFFTFVPHSGAFGERLPQVLFYARLAGDICGRLAPHWLHLRSSAAVLAAGAAKAALLALLVPAMLRPQLVGGDTQLALLIAANWWMSGYINTGAYLLAPKLAAQAAAAGRFQRPGSSSSKGSGGGGSASVKARAGGIMALAFQMSCFAGLLGAWALQSWALAGWAQPLQESGVRFPASRAGDGQDQVLGDLAAAAAIAAAHAADVHVAGVGSAALSQAGTAAAAAAAAGSGSGG
uniref:Uncharacterized protein n=1 Tax=Tetradesmus obliquus TaxID=3088 RepID=A0A383VI82_TETOB|eukprot:jgi/Sobl393_1/18837/SZX65237.1